MALPTPAMINGQPNVLAFNNAPASNGVVADARLRGTLVTLAAAARSSGVTTAITNAAANYRDDVRSGEFPGPEQEFK